MSKKQWPQKLFWAIVLDMTPSEKLQVCETIIRAVKGNLALVELQSKAHAEV